MCVAADIILIITANQSNGNLSYTLNVFKTKHFLKSTQLFTRSEKISSNCSKNLSAIWNRLANGKGEMKCTYATQKEKLMRRQNECECEGQNTLRTRRCKWGAHVQVKMRCACAGKNAKPVRRPKSDAHAQLQMRCACAGQRKDAHAQAKIRYACARLNEVRMRRPKWDAHGQAKIRCERTDQNEMRTRRPKWDAHAQF